MSARETKLPQGWALASFEQIFRNVTSSTLKLKQKHYEPSGRFPVVDQGQNLIGGYTDDEDLLHPNAPPVIVFGDHTKCVKFLPFRFVQGADGVKVLETLTPLDSRYCYFSLKATSLPDKGYSRHFKFLRDSVFPVPPLNEQKRIVARIEDLQGRSRRVRESLEAIPDLLDQLRQSVLAAAFRGDLTKQWRRKHPDVEPASELLQRIRIERRKRWEQAELEKLKAKGLTGERLDSEFAKRRKQYKEPISVDTTDLPELPAGWCWTSWNEVGFCQNGRAFPSKYYLTEGVKLLRPGNLHVSGKIEWTSENTRWMPENWAERYKDYMIGPQELVMNLTAQSLADEFLGRVCITESEEGCLLNQRIARLTPVIVSRPFCLWLFKSPIFRRYVDTLNTGSLIQHMFTAQIEKFVFPLPPLKEQQALAKKVTELLERKEILADSVAVSMNRLESLDQCILGKAFRGGLVPQDPSDEPAAILLERIRELNAKEADEQRVKGKEASARIKQRGERDQAAP